jgi:hypothetical protein
MHLIPHAVCCHVHMRLLFSACRRFEDVSKKRPHMTPQNHVCQHFETYTNPF